jgi:hypothetical protein
MKDWERYWSSVRNLEKKYDSRVLVLSPGYANRVEQAWNEVQELLAPVSKGDGGLLNKSKSLESYLENLPHILVESRKIAEELTTLLGVKDEITNLERMQHIAELARFCREEPRPMRSWMDRKSLEETKEFLKSLEISYKKRGKLKEKLTDYSDDLLTLDLDSMIDFFEGPGNSILRILRPSYYNIRSQISQARVDSTFPQDVLVDLRIAKELQTIESELKMVEDKARKILGIYFEDEEPDINRAKEALRRAARSLWIVGRARAPKELRDNLCEGASPRGELVNKSNSLQSTLSKLRYETNQLRGLIPRKLPSTRKSIRKSPLKQVIDWAQIVNERFSKLSRVGGDALAARLTDHPTTYNMLLEDLKTVEAIQNFEDDIERKQEEFFKIFGSLFNGIHTDWNNILNAIGWTQRLVSTLQRGVPELLKKAVSENGSNLLDYPKIKDRWDEISLALDELEDRFETSYWPEPRHRYNLEKIRERLNLLRSRIDDLQTWIDYCKLKKALSEEGLGKFLQRLIDQKINRKKLVPVFQKSMYQGLIDLFFKENSNLETFRGRDHEQFISDFQRLDKKFIELTPQRVIEIANLNKPQGVFIQAPDSEITILMREATKKRRHMPLRQLFEKIPNLIRRLKPCLMMSPISVSQFLIPGGLHFDLVVFDEASQIYSEDAVGSIYRGDNLVVAGDPKQLPPTPFFQYTIDENFDWDAKTYEFDVFDSVLDECMSIGLPVQMLRWHYRSKHDSLISFSNDRFYNGRLVLFPASKMGSDDLGLEFVHVKNGIYDRGGRRNNSREAEVVTELVFKHFENHPEKTLGVVTFSISQKNTVQDAIEDRLRENPKFEKFFIENRLDGFFVKNLENVQGDERDVMIFSVGSGFDMEGKITMNFGPLNKTGGERRLNVAITRAREKVILVSSIRYDNINLNATESEGVHSLYHYLRYAERRPKNLIETAVGIRHISPLEADVSEEVESLGYKVIPWVGSSSFRVDLGILDPEDPGRFILGIICDGDNYRSADTSRDRDRLRGQVLESLGWRIHRIWSPDWVQRRKTEVERLKNALKTAEKSRKEVNTKIIQKSKLAKNKVKRVKVIETTGEKLQEVRPYSFVRLKPNHLFSRYTSTHKERYLRQYHSEVRRLLPQLVRGEGPIHIDLAFKRMNNAFRLRRATQYFREAFNEEVKKADGNSIEIKKEFLWSKNKKGVEIRVPVEGVKESFRSIEHVSPEEISKAMFLAAKHSLGLKEETLLNETASLLGFKRMGSNINETLKSIFDEDIKSGKLAQNGNLIIASQS